MKGKCVLLCILFLWSSVSAQKFTISGYIQDADNGEKLIAANIYDFISGSGTTSNTYGFYSLTLERDSVDLQFSYIGYQTQRIKIYLKKDQEFNIDLSTTVSLEGVEIIAEKVSKIEEETQMSKVIVPVEQIKKIPALLGEVDVLKTLQLLPGVQSGGEGQTGLYVRGGSPDQNLVLLDGVPVYNVSHILGLFSVFNADALRNVTLTKGGFPARFGGRLSSVLEINMKEGNSKSFHGEGSLGIISSKLTLEGPIVKDKTSFLLSGRRTYLDVLAAPIIAYANRESDEKLKPRFYFYDLNAKINHKFNDKHRLYFSGYLGDDIFGTKVSDDEFSLNTGTKWGNIIAASRWNYKISNKMFSNVTLTFSNYDINFGIEQKTVLDTSESVFSLKYVSGIRDFGAKVDFDYIPNPNHYLKFGANVTHHTYTPGALVLEQSFDRIEQDTTFGTSPIASIESSAYVEDDLKIGPLKANVGLHFSAFKVRDQTYFSAQPRIGLNALIAPELAMKASFSTMTQYINLLTSEALTLPTDLWVPSTDKIVPQKSWQIAFGLAKTWNESFEISMEAYYKKMKNVLSYQEGASFLLGLDNNWENKVVQGLGEAYGLELFVQKKFGKTTGWLGYTLAWNHRTFDEINGGKTFPFKYDRRHDVSIVVSHQLKKRVSLSAAWIYGTGNAISLPEYQYLQQYQFNYDGQTYYYNYDIQAIGEKNKFRLTDTHRLDVNVEFTWGKKRWQHGLVIGAYNAYWHKNPYFAFVENDYDFNTGEVTRVFKEVSILPIVPAISYKFKF